MATKIKLQRLGKMREPHYRIVIADARTKRDGRFIEAIGQYHPKDDPSTIIVDGERARYWLGVGAQPTDAVAAILKVTGDWQAFKGLPAPPPMLVAPPKADRKAIFEEASRTAAGLEDKPATTPRKRLVAPAAAGGEAAEVGQVPPRPATAEPTATAPAPEATAPTPEATAPTPEATAPTPEPTAPTPEPAGEDAEAGAGGAGGAQPVVEEPVVEEPSSTTGP